jgi:hypothetical protein
MLGRILYAVYWSALYFGIGMGMGITISGGA